MQSIYVIIMLCLRSVGMDSVINELGYKGTIFQRDYRKNDHFMVIFL